jgi:hypothetical protein
MTVRLESVTFTSGDGETSVPSYLATPDRDGRHPVVLILRGVAGPDDGYTEIALRLAERWTARRSAWCSRSSRGRWSAGTTASSADDTDTVHQF